MFYYCLSIIFIYLLKKKYENEKPTEFTKIFFGIAILAFLIKSVYVTIESNEVLTLKLKTQFSVIIVPILCWQY
jgi:hypothetical protein